MQSTPRPNLKLILAAICVIAGIVILWRSFGRPAESIATNLPPTFTEIALSVTAVENTQPAVPTVGIGMPTQLAPTQLAPTHLPPTQLAPTQPPDTISTTPLPITPVLDSVATQPVEPTLTASVTVVPTSGSTITALPTQTTAAQPTLLTNAATPLPAPATLPATFTTVVLSITPSPTTVANNIPTSTSTNVPTSVPNVTSTSTNMGTVVYRIEGSASKVLISYLDETGKDNSVEATLPWRIQFNAPLDADLAVDAFGTNDEPVPLSCFIEINGSTLTNDKTDNAMNGVACERFIN